ncbi:MAG: hypothetical protein RIA63_12415 [Cyclobacteriaceae bacterium]
MKNKQKAVLKILLIIPLLSLFSNLNAQTASTLVKKADSLFSIKQYTQSLELYKEVFSQGQYSESTLLKMAYIQEGLGRMSESLYYLNLYYLLSNDEQAAKKMEEIASKNHLYGYKADQTQQVFFLLREYSGVISKTLFAITILLFALLIYQKKRDRHPMPVAIAILVLLSVLFLHVNFSQKTRLGIVHHNGTYLMSGPSAGSSVITIINEGHMLDILDKKDVWVHAKWLNQDVYVKEDQVLMIES